MQPEQEIINRWTGSAPFWEKHRDIIRQMFAPVSEALAAEAQISSGHTILDIATGPGEPALSVAAMVGPQGKVFAIDPIPEMVAAARRAAERLNLKNVQFDVAFADALPFPSDTFDAVISRFGVMFFPTPADGLREMLRVLKPGKKLALAAWHFAERNPFHSTLSRVMDRFVDPVPLPPDALDAFRFATPGKLLQILTDAGATDTIERLLHFKINTAISLPDYFSLRIEMSEKLREKIATLSPERVAEVKHQALESLAEYSNPHGISFPAEVLIVSGAKRI